MKVFDVWYLPAAQLLQTRLVDAVGDVVVCLPAAHVDHEEQATEGWSFCAWYVEEGHAVQLVDVV